MEIIRKLLAKTIKKNSINKRKISYSQCGEDIIVDFIFNSLKIENIRYLDLGACYPIHLNNTYLFYANGHSGVVVEPNPIIFPELKKIRKRDTCLNVGVGVKKKNKANFYLMTEDSLGTFSKNKAEKYNSYGFQKIEEVIQIPLIPVNDIISDNLHSYPNYISLDIEGSELGILKNFNFMEFRPEVFCIETLTYTENKTEKKITDVIDFMVSKDYMLFGDTFINSIFVNRKTWKKR